MVEQRRALVGQPRRRGDRFPERLQREAACKCVTEVAGRVAVRRCRSAERSSSDVVVIDSRELFGMQILR